MEIITKIKGGIATNPRTNVYFNMNEILCVGDKGLSLNNLERLVEIGAADVFSTTPLEKNTAPSAVDKGKLPAYKGITNKNDLQKYAKVTLGVYIDKRLTVEKMVEEIEKQLK